MTLATHKVDISVEYTERLQTSEKNNIIECSEAAMTPQITLYYFNMRGRGEIIRLLLHAAGVEFIDQRVDFSDWPLLKPNTPEGTLPFMDINGKLYGESLPLTRFIARKYNLMGKTDFESLTVDIILNYVDDIRNYCIRAKMDKILTDEQKQQMESKLRTEVVPKYLSKLEKRLSENESGFLVGEGFSLADLAVLDILDTLLRDDAELLANFPRLVDHRAKIQAVPKVSKYLSSRPESNV